MSQFSTPALSLEFDIEELADWVELRTLSDGRFLSGRLQTALSQLGDGNAAGRAKETWAELQRRSKLCTAALGWRVQQGELVACRNHVNAAFHFFLASLSLGIETGYLDRRLFESCVSDVVRGITGGKSLRLGAPRSKGMPTSLDDSVKLYTSLSGDQPRDPLPSSDGDFGLDVVTWFEFRDPRGAKLSLLGQCATGKNWYEEDKYLELSVKQWTDHVRWAVEPVTFFAVPGVVPPGRWQRVAKGAGLVLDRPRLLELALRAPLGRRRETLVHEHRRRTYAKNAA